MKTNDSNIKLQLLILGQPSCALSKGGQHNSACGRLRCTHTCIVYTRFILPVVITNGTQTVNCFQKLSQFLFVLCYFSFTGGVAGRFETRFSRLRHCLENEIVFCHFNGTQLKQHYSLSVTVKVNVTANFLWTSKYVCHCFFDCH